MRKTINNVIDEIETFANNHLIIKSFKKIPIEAETLKDEVYPLLYVEVDRLVFSSGLATLSLRVNALDRLKKDSSNLISVLSDTAEILSDFYTFFNDNVCEFEFIFNDSAEADAIAYGDSDVLAGYAINIRVEIPEDRDETQIPTE